MAGPNVPAALPGSCRVQDFGRKFQRQVPDHRRHCRAMATAAAERIIATYRIETPLDPRRAAEILAGEQSSGTFVSVPGETEELRERFRARVENVIPVVAYDYPSLPGSRAKGGAGGAGGAGGDATQYTRAEVTVSWPLENVGYNLPTLVSTLCGNLYELAEFS